MGNLFQELKRRNVYKVATVYLALSWLLLQMADTLFPAFDMPDSAIRIFAVMLFFSLPLVIGLAWAFEITPEGIRKTESASNPAAIKFTKRDYAFSAVVALLVVVVVSQQLTIVRDPTVVEIPPGEAAIGDVSSNEAVATATLAELLESLPADSDSSTEKSIAILPLSNLSPDPDNAFFAAGIHEEILNQLAKIDDLRVTSRTSVMRFEGSAMSISEIASALNVDNILEGSVRYAGNQVRITAQLIRVSDDSHLWSETYERELADIFAIQSDVAMEVSRALQARLLPETQAKIQIPGSISTDAYSLFLQTRYRQDQASNRQTLAEDGWIMRGITDMRRAIDLGPGFARAYAELAFLLSARGAESATADGLDAWLDEREALAARALDIDPELGRGFDSLAAVQRARRNWAEADNYHQLAISVPSPEPRLF